MSKNETIAALMDSATTVFAEMGYEGASLRDVAAGAGTPLSTINMYFGNKADLFIAVMSQLSREIEADRGRILAERSAAHGGRPNLRDIVMALVTPVVARARSATVADRRVPRLLRHWVGAPPDVQIELRRRSGREQSFARWIAAVGEACPTLSNPEVVWGFSFIVGALYSWELMDNRYDEIIAMPSEDPEVIAERLIDFAVSGMQGLIDGATRPDLKRDAAVQ